MSTQCVILQAAGHLHATPPRSGDRESAQLLHNLRNKVKALQAENVALKSTTGSKRFTSTPDLTANLNLSFTAEEVCFSHMIKDHSKINI